MMTTSDRHGNRAMPVRLLAWAAIPALLLAPLIAMLFTREVNWTASDFAAAAAILGGAGLAIEVVIRLAARPLLRWLGIGMVVALGSLIWIDGAVGLF